MPSTPSVEEFKIRVILLLGKKRKKSETKWNLAAKAGWHLPAKQRQQAFDELVEDGLIEQFTITDFRKVGRRPTLYELTEEGIDRYHEEAKNHRRRVPA